MLPEKGNIAKVMRGWNKKSGQFFYSGGFQSPPL
jgi:hypothetical protein